MSKAFDQKLAGQVWHITQRCHQQQFLLQHECDRRRWLYWLFQARKRYGLSVLNYVVTSNHVHLLVQDQERFCQRAAMSLINGKTQAEFNRFHRRSGPVWEADYHVTAIQTNANLARCMTYLDMNMVRAGVVEHPAQWRCSGYFESLHPKKRGGCLDRDSVRRLLGFKTSKGLLNARNRWISSKLEKADLCREPYWTDSIAVGDLEFALRMKRALAFTYPGRRAQREPGCFAVREASALYRHTLR